MNYSTPALHALLDAYVTEWNWGQVLVQRTEGSFLMKHVEDRGKGTEQLRMVKVCDLRGLAQNDARGEYRPLRSAPNLISGWHTRASSPVEFEYALNALYPGSVADWFAARSNPAPKTDFRDYTERQSGMYRITAMLSDAQAVPVIRATCGATSCLKRRLWTAKGLPADAEAAKSVIPCLEPCAVLLEFARKAMRIEQQEPLSLALRPDDAASVVAGLERALAELGEKGRAAEVSSPSNPLRQRLVVEKLRGALALAKRPETSDE